MSLEYTPPQPDLFSILLDNPNYKIQLANLFLEQQDITCCKCLMKLNDTFIFAIEASFCVLCFAKEFSGEEYYSVVNLPKFQAEIQRHTRLNYQVQLWQIRQADLSDFTGKKTTLTYPKKQNKLLSKKDNISEQQDLKTLSNQTPQQNFCQKILECFENSQYTATDYMLAYLHQKSSVEIQTFLLKKKAFQDFQVQKFRKSLEQIAKQYVLNPKLNDQYQENIEKSNQQDSEIDDIINIFSETQSLLQDADEQIQILRKKVKSLKGQKLKKNQISVKKLIKTSKIKKLKGHKHTSSISIQRG